MTKKIELLAPGGDLNSIKAAILAGANAIYCGLDKFNARNRATNISFDDLHGILRLAHQHDCEVFLTLNILILENEFPALIKLLNKLVNTSIDGIIIQDLGLLYLLSNHFKSLKIHASTQLTTHNEGQLKFLNRLKALRANLSRELTIDEIKTLSTTAHEYNVQTEVFVHGSYCISFSGICYFSSAQSGNSGNRGRCSQACRDQYETTEAGKKFPLNLKDNSAFFDLEELVEAGVASLKIEGRIKKFDYVFTVVNTWRKRIQDFYEKNDRSYNNSELYKVFNRDFSNTWLKGEIHKDMFIDSPRDFSIQHLNEINNFTSEEEKEEGHLKFYKEKDELKTWVEKKIDQISISKAPLTISVSGEIASPLIITATTTDQLFDVVSEIHLSNKGTQPLNKEIILKRLKAIKQTAYFIHQLDLSNLKDDTYLPFKELTSLTKKLLFKLNDSRENIAPIKFPQLKKLSPGKIKPTLSVLISSPKDVHLSQDQNTNFYFQLPNCFKHNLLDYINLFKRNKKLIPWFPSVLIGEDYEAAVELLQEIQPQLIVSNNTGIAYEAFGIGIPWIAGPYLNIVNSWSLKALKENFNCNGAFISNEINKDQISQIKKPNNFKLHYSIFQPIVLMTSRQCLFHQVTGCDKNKIENTCIQNCDKLSAITNLKKETFLIEKTKGNYHRVYNALNFLNLDIISDLPNVFSSFLIDLSDLKTETKIELEKSEIIKLFKNIIEGKSYRVEELKKQVYPSTNKQYKKGI